MRTQRERNRCTQVTAMAFSGLQNTPWSRYDFPYLPSGFSNNSVQFSCVWLFVTTWTAARQASLSITTSCKLMSIVSVRPSNHLLLCCPLLLLPSSFPSIRGFSNKLALCIRCQSIGASASGSALPMNIQDWFYLEWTGWISLQFKGLSRVFSNIIVQKQQFFSTQLSL